MRLLIVIFIVLFSSISHANDSHQSIEQFMQEYLDGYEEYLMAGDNADTSSLTRHFTEPLVMMPKRGPAPMATHETFAPNIKYFLEKSLRDKGVVKLAWQKLQVAKLSDSQALVSGLANTLDSEGNVVDQRASIYLLSKTKQGWAVSVNLPHPPENIPALG